MKRIILILCLAITFQMGFSQQQGTFKDTRDGKDYKTVKIGSQTWLAENLAYKAVSGCWAYQDKESNVTVSGYLYNYETALNTCPAGWHLPTKKEVEALTNQVGGLGKNAFAALLNDGSSGFSVNLTSWRNSRDNSYGGIGQDANFWASTPNGAEYAWTLYFRGYDKGAFIFSYYKTNGLSVRCIQN
jgi:uncharacterized protein (TIGR02145 family)